MRLACLWNTDCGECALVVYIAACVYTFHPVVLHFLKYGNSFLKQKVTFPQNIAETVRNSLDVVVDVDNWKMVTVTRCTCRTHRHADQHRVRTLWFPATPLVAERGGVCESATLFGGAFRAFLLPASGETRRHADGAGSYLAGWRFRCEIRTFAVTVALCGSTDGAECGRAGLWRGDVFGTSLARVRSVVLFRIITDLFGLFVRHLRYLGEFRLLNFELQKQWLV